MLTLMTEVVLLKFQNVCKKNAENYNEKANISNVECLCTTTNKVIKKIKYKTVYKFSLFKNGKIYKKGKNGKKEIIYKITKNE